jgi:hypothetical protein
MCNQKNVMTMENVPREKFWQSIQILEALYRIRGAIVEIRNYEGKTIQEAAGLMKMQGNAKVWQANEKSTAENVFEILPPPDIIH